MEINPSLVVSYMKRPWALTKKADYVSVYQQGKVWRDNLVVMRALPTGLTLSRYGLSVSKRVGNAVKRNRLKRLLREIMRLQLVKPGWDIVLIVQAQAVDASYHQLKNSVTKLLVQAQLLIDNDKTVNS